MFCSQAKVELCFPLLSFAFLCFPLLSFAFLCFPLLPFAFLRNCMQLGWNCYPALESGLFGVICIEKCMILVDRVAIKSMDSRGDWGRTSVRQRSGQKLYANWLEMLPCPTIWNSWCDFCNNRYLSQGPGEGRER